MKMKMAQLISARNSGIASREVAGNWMMGMNSHTLMKRIQKNMVARNGAHLGPSSGPMIDTATWSSSVSYPSSATFWTPAGTSAFFRIPTTKSKMQIAVDTNAMSAVLLNAMME